MVWVEPSGKACPGLQRTRQPDTAEQRTSDSAGGRGGPQPTQETSTSKAYNKNQTEGKAKVVAAGWGDALECRNIAI